MKKNEIKVGDTYMAKVNGRVVPVRIDGESGYGGWLATNVMTNKKIRIKTAQRLRRPANRNDAGRVKRAKPEAQATDASAKRAVDYAKPKKLSALDAAAKVLAESEHGMNCQEMIDAMATKGYWTSPGGKTPSATLYAAITREIKVKGADARFHKAERGQFVATAG